MTDILLVKPDSGQSVIPPIGLGYLSTALKKAGLDPKVVHCGLQGLDVDGVVRLLEREGTRMVGVSLCSSDHFWLCELAEKLKDVPDVCLTGGGVHATGLGARLMELVPRIDYLVTYEGETALPRLVAAVRDGSTEPASLAGIPNLVWRDADGRIVQNEPTRCEDLDSLGFPDWEQMRPAEYARFAPHGGAPRGSPVGQLMTTRGCPYGCNYCAGPLIQGRKIRRRSAESLVAEIEYLSREHDVKEFHFEDDNFTHRKSHVVDVCQAVRKKGIKAHFALPNGVRIDRIDDEILGEMQATGFYTTSLGIESGSQETLRRMGKKLELGRIAPQIRLLRKYGFQLKGFFMLGYPGESAEDIQQTIDFAKSLDLDRAYFSMYMPLPGTRDFETLEEQGEIDVKTIDWARFETKGETEAPFAPKGMTLEQVKGFAHLAYRSFYMRPKIMYKMLRDLRVNSVGHFFEIGWNLARLNLSYFI